ncbi:hypothetical protein ABW20_dc0104369 [Dactylellina cionopaga]|nr:hypothetical protein ABW20_dc0104369 [Dactylellina cionopaga]
MIGTVYYSLTILAATHLSLVNGWAFALGRGDDNVETKLQTSPEWYGVKTYEGQKSCAKIAKDYGKDVTGVTINNFGSLDEGPNDNNLKWKDLISWIGFWKDAKCGGLPNLIIHFYPDEYTKQALWWPKLRDIIPELKDGDLKYASYAEIPLGDILFGQNEIPEGSVAVRNHQKARRGNIDSAVFYVVDNAVAVTEVGPNNRRDLVTQYTTAEWAGTGNGRGPVATVTIQWADNVSTQSGDREKMINFGLVPDAVGQYRDDGPPLNDQGTLIQSPRNIPADNIYLDNSDINQEAQEVLQYAVYNGQPMPTNQQPNFHTANRNPKPETMLNKDNLSKEKAPTSEQILSMLNNIPNWDNLSSSERYARWKELVRSVNTGTELRRQHQEWPHPEPQSQNPRTQPPTQQSIVEDFVARLQQTRREANQNQTPRVKTGSNNLFNKRMGGSIQNVQRDKIPQAQSNAETKNMLYQSIGPQKLEGSGMNLERNPLNLLNSGTNYIPSQSTRYKYDMNPAQSYQPNTGVSNFLPYQSSFEANNPLSAASSNPLLQYYSSTNSRLSQPNYSPNPALRSFDDFGIRISKDRKEVYSTEATTRENQIKRENDFWMNADNFDFLKDAESTAEMFNNNDFLNGGSGNIGGSNQQSRDSQGSGAQIEQEGQNIMELEENLP